MSRLARSLGQKKPAHLSVSPEREGTGREEGEGVVRPRPSVRPPFEEMGALNVKKWSAAASVAESEDLMDCSMSHVGGGREARRPQERPERVKLNGLAEVAPSPSLPPNWRGHEIQQQNCHFSAGKVNNYRANYLVQAKCQALTRQQTKVKYFILKLKHDELQQ